MVNGITLQYKEHQFAGLIPSLSVCTSLFFDVLQVFNFSRCQGSEIKILISGLLKTSY